MKKFVFKNQVMNGIVYNSDNVVIQKVQEGKNHKRCYIVGNGHSLSVTNDHIITKHDPAMQQFQPKISKDITIYAFYFTFECVGMEASSKEIAIFVNSLSNKYEQIFLIGHSKCGLCLYNASHYCTNAITLVTISTPFKGSIIADKNSMNKILKFQILKSLYNDIFSDHNVDKDIMPNSQFIQNLQTAFYKEHINIISSLKKVSSCKDFMDLILLFWDKILQINGDGIVSYVSQMINSTRTIEISCSHANSLIRGLAIIEKL